MNSFKEYITETKKVKGVYRNGKLSASVDVLIKLAQDLPIEERDVKKMVKINHDVRVKEGMFDDMIENPNEKFMKRTEAADMQYPILIDSRDYIVDGAHRLAKAYFGNQEKIQVKVISRKILEKAAKITKAGKESKESLVEFIRHEGDKYVVRSEKGKNMGKFPTETAAKKRLRQIEYFKHAK